MLTNKITPPPIQGVEVIKPNLSARAWQWKDPKTIPPRQWLYGAHYVRKFASATLAPGGVGKSSLGLVDAVGMACGRNLLGGESTNRPLAVWYWNLEDPAEEIDRRVSAILLHYHIDYEEVRDRFFVNSEEELVIAEKTRDMTLVRPEITGALISEISALSIDAVIIDPFVSCHRVPENDNGGMDVVAKAWARIARDANCAVELVHHVRKPSNGQSEFGVNDGRGAVSLISATRSNRVLNRMTEAEAERAGIPLAERRSYFRVDKGEKDNLRPAAEKAEWRKLVSVDLHNSNDAQPWGDKVGVVTAWQMPGAFDDVTAHDIPLVQKRISEGEWREDSRSPHWAGIAIAEVLDLDLSDKGSKADVKTILATRLKTGVLKIESRKDEQRKLKNYVVAGTVKSWREEQ